VDPDSSRLRGVAASAGQGRFRGGAASAGQGRFRGVAASAGQGRLRRADAAAASAGQGRLRVTVTDGRGRPVRDGGLARWLSTVAPAQVRGECAVALVSDAHVRALNRRYRRKDVSTDVLSFPVAAGVDALAGGPDRLDRTLAGHLGDVVIATGVARRQARDAGHAYATELRVLALHGFLHLLGYDHENPADAGRMARLEARLRRKGGLRAGLIDRTHRVVDERARKAGGRRGRRS
jgi:probable rRNA maturation factor